MLPGGGGDPVGERAAARGRDLDGSRVRAGSCMSVPWLVGWAARTRGFRGRGGMARGHQALLRPRLRFSGRSGDAPGAPGCPRGRARARSGVARHPGGSAVRAAAGTQLDVGPAGGGVGARGTRNTWGDRPPRIERSPRVLAPLRSRFYEEEPDQHEPEPDDDATFIASRSHQRYPIVRHGRDWWSVELPEPFESPRLVRTCDLVARSLSPALHVAFSLGWERARRDAAIAEMRALLDRMAREGWRPAEARDEPGAASTGE